MPLDRTAPRRSGAYREGAYRSDAHQSGAYRPGATWVVGALLALALLAGCESDHAPAADARPELLLYCGITMVNPMTEIVAAIEREHRCRITLTQGGSEDLYQSLKASQRGDLYLPGSASYRARHLDEGLLGEYRHVGYNQAALMVRKGNPKGVRADIRELLRDDLKVVICNPESGSIGRETQRILKAEGIYDAVFARAIYLTTDSRNLNNALKRGDADLVLNWRATAYFADNAPHMEVLDLPTELVQPKKLLINLLNFAAHPEIARQLMDYAASDAGQAILRRHGFIDRDGHS